MTDEITLDPQTARRIEGEIASIAEALQGERASMDGKVGSLVGGGWTGVAAEQYRDGWQEWCQGADTVLRALSAMGRLIGEARVELTGIDDAAGGAAGRLHSRLGPA